jgi:signal transduction histidine kinase
VVFVDSSYTHRAASPRYCEEHERTREEILGRSVADLFGEATFQETLKPHMDRCLSGESVAFHFWWSSPHRGRLHIDVRYDPFFEDDGSVSGVLVDVWDTTEQTLTKKDLERSIVALKVANLDLEAFSDSIAHDLKTPLLTVTNYSHYLGESIGDSLDEEQEGLLRRVQLAGKQMRHIIDDLCDLADVRRTEMKKGQVDLTAMALGIMDDLTALKPDHLVIFEAEPEIMAVGDGRLLKLLLTNLLQNAWKYTGLHDEARIDLSVIQDDPDDPVYQVRDNGVGFDNTQREKIFEAFQRLDTGGQFGGSGLGLATVQRVVHRHGGRVWAEGVPNEGAVFSFTLGSSLIHDRRSRGPRSAP